MVKEEIKLYLLSFSTIASIQEYIQEYFEIYLIFNKIKIWVFNSSKFPSSENTLGNTFSIVKICFPSEINVEKNINSACF